MSTAHDIMAWVYDQVVAFSLPLAVVAWLTVVLASVGLGTLLWRCALQPGERRWAVGVGVLALACHLQDLGITLWLTPDPAFDASPVWLAVVRAWGQAAAVGYGLSGKLLLALLSYQLFALYLVQRRGLYPPPGTAEGFRAFWAAYGAGEGLGPQRFLSWTNLFAFVFPLVAPLMLYVSLLNAATHPTLLQLLPPWPVACVLWVGAVAVGWAVVTWKAWLSWRGAAQR
jgi:hypothetical protein